MRIKFIALLMASFALSQLQAQKVYSTKSAVLVQNGRFTGSFGAKNLRKTTQKAPKTGLYVQFLGRCAGCPVRGQNGLKPDAVPQAGEHFRMVQATAAFDLHQEGFEVLRVVGALAR